MKNEYVRSFVIGSSCFVFLPYFWVVSGIKKSERNYDYITYTFIAPIYLGCMNLLSLIIAKQYDLSRRDRYLLISMIAPTIVAIFVEFFYKAYNYTSTQEWIQYIIKLYMLYFIVFNGIVALLDVYV